MGKEMRALLLAMDNKKVNDEQEIKIKNISSGGSTTSVAETVTKTGLEFNWTSRGIGSSDGTWTASTSTRMAAKIDRAEKITAPDGFEIEVQVFNGSAYQGVWNGKEIVKTASWNKSIEGLANIDESFDIFVTIRKPDDTSLGLSASNPLTNLVGKLILTYTIDTKTSQVNKNSINRDNVFVNVLKTLSNSVATFNLFDGTFEKAAILTYDTGAMLGTSGRSAVIPAFGNTTYTIKKYTTSGKFRVCYATDETINKNTIFTIIKRSASQAYDDTATEQTITTPANAKWIAISVAGDTVEPDMNVVFGDTAPASFIPYGTAIPVTQG